MSREGAALKVRQRSIYGLGIALAVAAGSIGWALIGRRDPFIHTANEVRRAIKDRDGARLFAYIPEDEKKAYDLSAEKLTDLLANVVRPKVDLTDTEPHCEQTTLTQATCSIGVANNGHPSTLYIGVGKTDAGYQVPGLVKSLIGSVLISDYLRSRQKDGATKRRHLLQSAVERRQQLDKLGFHGLYDANRGRFVGWDEYCDSLRQSLL